MEIRNRDGKYFKIKASPGELQADMLLHWRRKDGIITAENNLVNRIVLGLDSSIEASGDYDYWRAKLCSSEEYSLLKSYQIEDVIKMCSIKHILNANPMGLGKTVETIIYLKLIEAKSILIVTPKIIRHQWRSQIERWWGRESEIYEKQQFIDQDKIWIINYDKLRSEKILNKFQRFRWDVVVLDEAHKIKNRDSKQSRAVKRLPADRRVALTGTPILSYVDDLWSIFNFLDQQYSGVSYWSFIDYFCRKQVTPWGTKIIGLVEDSRRLEILERVRSLICIRNSSTEVAHGKTSEIVKLPMEKDQRALYRREKDLLLHELPENCTIANGAVLSIRLRQTTSWPGLFLDGMPGPKFEWILELCKNSDKEKIVVFSVFERTIVGLIEYLESNGVSAVSITGKNKSETNECNKQIFIERDIKVLAGTIGAMGQGYDGLQNVSHTLVFIDREWSPEIMAQAEDRLHRMGQDNLVNIYYLECQGSFDQHVGRINQSKVDDIRRALTDG